MGEIGVGINSSNSGRYVPALTAGIGSQSWLLSGSSTGVRSGYYYQSTYTASFLYLWKNGELLGGDIVSGVGFGAMYSEYGLHDEGASLEYNKNGKSMAQIAREKGC